MRFNVIGHITSEIGLGVMAADLVEALAAAGHDVIGYDVDPQLDRKDRSIRLRPYLRQIPQMYSDGVDVAVFPINVAAHWSRSYCFGSRRVAVPLWELPVVNPAWLIALNEFDGVLAASGFIAETLQRYGVDVWPTAWPHYLPFDAPLPGARAEFGLPEDSVLFMYHFDPSSDLRRKNPQAVIEAFKRAALSNARLVLQINRSADQPIELMRWFDRGPDADNVIIIDRHLSHEDALKLIAACDVYVSLHRAEGLGLGMLEAMQLGRPVIATGWSGNLSFMDRSSACLVDYKLIQVDGSIPAYQARAIGSPTVWADPDIDQAACWMRFLAENADRRAELGYIARQKAVQYAVAASRLDWIEKIPAQHVERPRAGQLEYVAVRSGRVIVGDRHVRLIGGESVALSPREADELMRLGYIQ